ncbi:MAG TPA: hypothetical protein VGD78_08540, partial [Chthoniobacterales bacterium]
LHSRGGPANEGARALQGPYRGPRISRSDSDSDGFGPFWQALGPSPLPNGQTYGTEQVPVSGRVSAIAVDPFDPNLVYLGPAQGGVWRSFDGGRHWAPLMFGADNLAVGSITIDPCDHTRVLVGTGEGNFSGDSHFGRGLYMVENATSARPTLRGSFNLDSSGHDVLSYRSVVSIVVSPLNDNVVFVATSSAFGGLGIQTGPTSPPRGLYRCTNFRSGSPAFDRLKVGPGTDTRVTSAVMDPTRPFRLVCNIFGLAPGTDADTNPEGGIYYTDDALSPVPVFKRAVITDTSDGNLPQATNVKFAVADLPGNSGTEVLAATAEVPDTTTIDPKTGQPVPYIDQGIVRKSLDGGATFQSTLPSANGFAGGQGSYNIAIAIDPTDPKNVYLAGTVSAAGVDPDGGGPEIVYLDSGAHFVPSVQGLHADSHAIGIAPSKPKVLYTGNDGGVWRSDDGGKHWNDVNTYGLLATQFQSVAVHPTDPVFTIGGTQDNGTPFLQPNGQFTRADYGDGGYALIDQGATDTENVTMYHTYYNATGSMIGFARVTRTSCAKDGQWSFFGIYTGSLDPTVHCDGFTDSFNGIQITDNVNFYAPMALGPGQPNTVYFGTDRLYRSIDRGKTMRIVSQKPLVPDTPGSKTGIFITAIGVSPLDDRVRLVGLEDGQVFGTATGSDNLRDVTGPIPANYVTRVVIDPTDQNVAYVTLNGYGLPSGQQVWKTTNLVDALGRGAVPDWKPAGKGIPDVSVNALAIDALNPSDLYAGADDGVYASRDGGSSWRLYGRRLPAVEVYDVAIQQTARVLRVATHGLGLWQAPLASGCAFWLP